jgi:integrase/recombinase XerC/integrase/recombinase XerD
MEISTNNQVVTVQDERLKELVNHFALDQDVRENSRQLYKRTVNLFLAWVKGKGFELKNITRVEIIQYKEALVAGAMSSLTVGSYITSVRRFFEWCEANKYYPNVAKGIKSPKRKQQFRKLPLTPTQSKNLLTDLQEKSLQSYFKGKALRDLAIVTLLLRTGLRTIEAIRANVEDITFKGDKRVLLVHGKGRDEKDNFVVLTDKAYQPIEDYLDSRGKINSGEPLFISTSNNSKGERLTTRSISFIAKEALKEIGLNTKAFTAHSLRHTTAVNILRAGGSLNDAQGVLRHTSPATTQIYTHTINEEKRLLNSAEELLDKMF